MRIQFRDRDGKISKDLRLHVQGRLGLALGKFGERVERVNVRLSELSGEKHCQIEVGVRAGSIRVEGSHANTHAAIDHAISRASSSLVRMLEREQIRDATTDWQARGTKS